VQLVHLRRAWHIADDAGQFPAVVPCVKQLHRGIDAALKALEILSRAVSVHDGLLLRPKLRAAVKRHGRILMHRADSAGYSGMPRGFDQRRDLFNEKLLTARTAQHLLRELEVRQDRRIIDLLVLHPHKILVKRRRGVRVGHVKGDMIKGNLQLRKSLSETFKSMDRHLCHIHGYEDCLCFPVVQRQRCGSDRVVHIFGAAHVHLPLHQNRPVGRDARLRDGLTLQEESHKYNGLC